MFDQESILVVDSMGLLRKIYCPFKVRVIIPIPVLTLDEYYHVQCVMQDRSGTLIYVIKGQNFFYFNFSIELD